MLRIKFFANLAESNDCAGYVNLVDDTHNIGLAVGSGECEQFFDFGEGDLRVDFANVLNDGDYALLAEFIDELGQLTLAGA